MRLSFVSMAGCNLASHLCKCLDIPHSFVSGHQLNINCGEYEGYRLLNHIEREFNHMGQDCEGVNLYQKKRIRKG